MSSSVERSNDGADPTVQHQDSSTPAATTTTSPSPTSPPQIRHSGHVQVRGRIRRVWRPRHLELLADGHLKYYDQETNALKYTLQISSARILDGTTLRDLHVGLPRGTFGFLIRGQRVWNEETERLPSYERSSKGGTGHHFHPYASTANTGALVSESFVLAEAPEPVRDYLCAVDSLEEAQMWVVALQWAATVTDTELLSWWKVDYCASTTPHSTSSSPNALAASATHPGPSESVTITKESSTAAASKPEAKVLVAKVTECTLVRSSTFSVELAYNIDVLLLCTSPSAKIESNTTSAAGYTVEEWSLVRTADDFAAVEPLQHPIPTWKTAKTAAQVQNAVSVLDSVLRSWVLSTEMVQNPAFQQFLALHHDPTKEEVTTRSWLHMHDPTSIRTGPSTSIAYQPPNQFVQAWLQRTHSNSSHQCCTTQQIIAWRPHAWWLGSLAMIAWPVAKRTLACVPSIQVRLDCLLLSWAGAAYLGYHRKHSLVEEKKAAAAAISRKKRKQKSQQSEAVHTESGTGTVVSPLGEAVQDEDQEGRLVDDDEESEGEAMDAPAEFSTQQPTANILSSPLPEYPNNNGTSCWSQPPHDIFHVRGANYFRDKVKIPSHPSPLTCCGVDVWLTDNPVRHIARHPSVEHNLQGGSDKLVVNFLLPFANFVAYFDIPPLSEFPSKVGSVWSKFLQGDQQYRDARLKLLPVVMEGPCKYTAPSF